MRTSILFDEKLYIVKILLAEIRTVKLSSETPVVPS